MNFRSTRNRGWKVPLSQALAEGLAPDGGLYVPDALPPIDPGKWPDAPAIGVVAEAALARYFAGDVLEGRLQEIVHDAFNFPVPLRPLQDTDGPCSLLELFHGPTAAFKDLGAGFLAACLDRLPVADPRPLTVLVATSGDTGGAVASAFHGRPGFRVVLLYPAGRVSPMQERQLCGWGDNVRSFAVGGSFDNCQALAKRAFGDARLCEQLRLTSANSINVGRLLPQLVSFAYAAQSKQSAAREVSFVIPSGNLGHAVACLWARAMGFPIGTVILAHNANRAMVDFLAGGEWRPTAPIATIASAMDVGDPSNRERLLDLIPEPDTPAVRIEAASIDDEAIRECIRAEHRRSGIALCPHSAVAMEAWRRLPEVRRRDRHWVVVATAHAAKFPEIVEPLIGETVPPPAALAGLLERPFRREEIDLNFDSFRDRLLAA